KALGGEGSAIVYITHRLGEGFSICDSVSVLRNGALVATRRVGDIDRRRLIETMLGRSFVEMYPEPPRAAARAAMVVEDLCVPGCVKNFSMTASRGQIVCIAGQVGSGAGEVFAALAGLEPEATGRVTVDGKPLRLGSAAAALKRNVMYVSGDRAEEGLFRTLSVRDNLVATRLGAHARCGV